MIKPAIERVVNNGTQKLYFFENGYGASVVCHSFSYGHEAELWELAVIKGTQEKWSLEYDTPISDDVLGWLNNQDVEDLLVKIQNLPTCW